MSPAGNNLRLNWGDDAPDWIKALAEMCDKSSQKRAADVIGYSPAVVNQVLKRAYKGDLAAVEKAVRGALMNVTLLCPVAGEINAARCIELQRQPFAATNPQRVRLYRACRNGCPHAKQQGGHS